MSRGTALIRNREPFTFAFAGRTANKARPVLQGFLLQSEAEQSEVRELRDREFAGTDYEDIPILQAGRQTSVHE